MYMTKSMDLVNIGSLELKSPAPINRADLFRLKRRPPDCPGQ